MAFDLVIFDYATMPALLPILATTPRRLR